MQLQKQIHTIQFISSQKGHSQSESFMTNLINRAKNITNTDQKLSFLFRQDPSLAWEMVEQQCYIYTNPNINVQQINKLSSMYSKIVQKLNILQDPRQKYFNNKMCKLMAQPFVIRCYTQYSQKKETNINLNQKRKQLQQKLSIQNQKSNSQTFQHIINTQSQKQKKLQQKINQVLQQHQKSLESRLQLRSMKKQLSSPKKKSSEDNTLSNSQQYGGNPENKSPQSTILNLDRLKNYDYLGSNSNRPLSQRIMTYQFNVDSSDSQDQYEIQKRIKEQENRNMSKKRKIEFGQQHQQQNQQVLMQSKRKKKTMNVFN